MSTVTIDGADIDYVEQGSGAPVVFVHGGLSDRRTWGSQLDAFAASHRAVAYSRRYHWPNTAIADGVDYHMTPHVNDLAAFLRAIDAVPAHLVGNSWGAFVCLMLASREPSLVRTLVLGEPPVLPLLVSNPPKPRELARMLLTSPRTGVAVMRFGIKTIGRAQKAFRNNQDDAAMEIFVDGALGRNVYNALPEPRRAQMRENLKTLKAEFLGSGFEPFSAADVRKVVAPTLIVTGERSPQVLQRLADTLEPLLPNVERVAIPNASHLMHEENASDYNEAVLNFLGRNLR